MRFQKISHSLPITHVKIGYTFHGPCPTGYLIANYFRHKTPCVIRKLTADFVSKRGGGGCLMIYLIAEFRRQNGWISPSSFPNFTIMKRVVIQIQLMNINMSECKYYCLHLVPKFGDVRDRQNWRLHPTVIVASMGFKSQFARWLHAAGCSQLYMVWDCTPHPFWFCSRINKNVAFDPFFFCSCAVYNVWIVWNVSTLPIQKHKPSLFTWSNPSEKKSFRVLTGAAWFVVFTIWEGVDRFGMFSA